MEIGALLHTYVDFIANSCVDARLILVIVT